MAFLELKDVGKIYASEGNIAVGIRSVNLSFDRGELVAVTGASGSGKTTLLSVISGMDTYEEGELLIEGEPTSHYTERDREYYREKYISFVFQDYNIIESFTVLQNVELALMHVVDRRERRRRALDLIERVGLLAEAKQKGSTLSGGQKQRTVIARALAKDSPILLADEPTGNLDAKSAKEIVELLADVAEDKLVIVVTHSLDELEGVATRHVRIFDGGVESDRLISPPRKATSESVKAPQKTAPHLTLRRGALLGRSLLLARPRLSAFLSLLLFVGMLAVFLLTSLCRDAGEAFSSPTMFTHIDGRVVVTTRDGKPIPSSVLSDLADSLGATSSLSLDLLLDKKSNNLIAISDSVLDGYVPGFNDRYDYYDDVQYIYGLRYAYGETMPRPDVGRAPETESEVMLSLPIGYRDFFGKNKLLVSHVTIGKLEYRLVGVNYYYDNNLSPRCHLTEKGFAYASAIDYILNEMDVSLLLKLDTGKNKNQVGLGDLSACFGMEKPIYIRLLDGYLDLIPGEAQSYTAELSLKVYDYSGDSENSLAERVFDEKDFAAQTGEALFLDGQGSVVVDVDVLYGLALEVIPLSYAQSSLFFGNDERAGEAVAELRTLGYVAVPSYTTYTPDPLETVVSLIGAVMQVILWLFGTLFVAFFLSVAVGRALAAFKNDIAILRSMGIPSAVVCIGVYFRMFFAMLPGALLVALVAVLIFRNPTLNGYFAYLYAQHYLVIALGALILTFAVTYRSTKRLFGRSVKNTLRGGDRT